MLCCQQCGVEMAMSAKFCTQCGHDNSWPIKDVDQSEAVIRYASAFHDVFFDPDNNTINVDELIANWRSRLKISFSRHKEILSFFQFKKEQISGMDKLTLEFDSNVLDAYAGHDTRLVFRATNPNASLDSYKVTVVWTISEDTSTSIFRAATQNFIHPGQELMLAGTHTFARAGYKEISNAIVTIEDQFFEKHEFSLASFNFKVSQPSQQIVQNITTHNKISIEGRGVIDASGMGTISDGVDKNIYKKPNWIKLKISLSKEETIRKIKSEEWIKNTKSLNINQEKAHQIQNLDVENTKLSESATSNTTGNSSPKVLKPHPGRQVETLNELGKSHSIENVLTSNNSLIPKPENENTNDNRVIAEMEPAPLFDESYSHPPPLGLLKPASQENLVSAESLERTSKLIEERLKLLGVDVRVISATPGISVCRFEFVSDERSKSRLLGLGRDLSRQLGFDSVRLISKLAKGLSPSTGFVTEKSSQDDAAWGMEIPHNISASLCVHHTISTVSEGDYDEFTIAVGQSVEQSIVPFELSNLLITGTNHSGKSNLINSIILGFIYKVDPVGLRFILASARLDISIFNKLPHLLHPVINDLKSIVNALGWLRAEMYKRYKLMSTQGVRNLAAFNSKIIEARQRGEDLYNPFSLTPESPEPLVQLPRVVMVIDELFDLIQIVEKEIIEDMITPILEQGTAAGIYLIVTADSSKAEMLPASFKNRSIRTICLKTETRKDSFCLIGCEDAKILLGRGDMLFTTDDPETLIRAQSAIVSDDEINNVKEYLLHHWETSYLDFGFTESPLIDGRGLDEPTGPDPLFDQAVKVVFDNKKASISLVQRHLKIGYNRAARMLEEMENAGLVSAMNGNGQREILRSKARQ